MPDVNVDVHKSEVGAEGIKQNNETLERTEEQELTAATRQSGIGKIESKLKKDHPDWPEDKIKTIATAAFERALSKITGKSSNEGNEDFREPMNDKKGGW